MPRNKRLHFKDVDVLRFFMVLPVFLACSMLSLRPTGEGITVEIAKVSQHLALNSIDFFVFLSAFMITSHALREYKYRESFSLKFFYYRRLLRISSLLIILFIFIFLLHPWIIEVLQLFTVKLPDWKNYILGIPNYLGRLNGSQDSVLVVIWFIFLILQFYFLWGVILKFFRKFILHISIALIVAGIVYRYFYSFGDSYSFTFDTLAYMSPIGIGATTAYFIRAEHSILDRIKNLKKAWVGLLYFFLIIHLLSAYLLASSYILPLVPVISSLLFAFIIMEQTYGKNSIVKFRKNKFLSHLGKISYGLVVYYSIFSILIFIGIESLDFDLTSNLMKVIAIILTFALSWLTADISYNLIEQPFRNFKRNFKRD